MNTTATKQKAPADPVKKAQEIVQRNAVHGTRLAYNPQFQEKFGVTSLMWNAICNSVYPHASSVDSLVMVMAYCKARGLDPMKKPVHIVPMYDAKLRRNVDTVWPSITEVRITAFRTKEYAGCDEAVFGPEVKQTFTGKITSWDKDEEGNSSRKPVEKTVEAVFPQWCQITVYRDLNGVARKFVGPKVYWKEAFASIQNSGVPNSMWERRAYGQLEKCAEAAALRKAFPEEMGTMYAAEEMAGRVRDDDSIAAVDSDAGTSAAAAKANDNAASNGKSSKLDAFGAADEVDDAEVIETEKPKKKKSDPGMTYTVDESKEQLAALLEELRNPLSPDDLFEIVGRWRTSVMMMAPAHKDQAQGALDVRSKEILGGDEEGVRFLPQDD